MIGGVIPMDYSKFYDMVMEEEQKLLEMEIYKEDYKLIKALASLYELQNYLSNRIVEEIADGKRDDLY